jgi:hypothetical protein
MSQISLTLLVLKTRQLDVVRNFYAALGIAFMKEQHGKGPVHYAGQLGDLTLEIYPLTEESAAADATTRLGFAVGSLTKIVESLKSAGAPVVSLPQQTAWGLRAVVRDPDGRMIELYQR